MESWDAALYGHPCVKCGYDWSISPQKAVELVARVPARYAGLLAGTDGSQRHPDVSWTAGAYVCHVNDNLRIWAERVAGAALGGGRLVPTGSARRRPVRAVTRCGLSSVSRPMATRGW